MLSSMGLQKKTMKNYIKSKLEKQNYFTIKGIEIFVDSELPKECNARSAISKAFSMLPSHLFSQLKSIHIGKYKELEDRELTALYKNKKIYLSNDQDSTEDMIDDIIHEAAHLVEDVYKGQIYSDGKIKNEFLQKRKKLWYNLKNKDFSVELNDFLQTKYDEQFDMFLYKKIGYPILRIISSGLFLTPYSITSLREYFATAFEQFYLKQDISLIKKVSPELYRKILLIDNLKKVKK